MSNQQGTIRLSDFMNKIPFANRIVVILVAVLWALDFTGLTSTILMNDPVKFWSPNYELWRVFTASFCLSSLFDVLIAAVNLYTFYPKLEFKTSSISILFNFVVTGAVIQLLYCILYLCLPAFINKYVAHGDFCGIWFNLILKYCYFNRSTKIKLCCFHQYISKLAYPFVFLVLIMLINFSIKLDALIGILLALIQCRFLSPIMIPFRSDFCCQPLSRFSSWVPASGTSAENPYLQMEQQMLVPRWSQSTHESNQDYFRNKKGVKLGEG